jgi:hypothetical protein
LALADRRGARFDLSFNPHLPGGWKPIHDRANAFRGPARVGKLLFGVLGLAALQIERGIRGRAHECSKPGQRFLEKFRKFARLGHRLSV